ncbi:MAG: AAA family ATPase [Deltaproteobacteria bacterium]|nr:AAA family ATPase [Deltaproteobacteria bacterium]
MEKIAIYGKGGVGKSMVATNLSAYYALQGKRVIHLGCDPKQDSAIRLMEKPRELKTVLDVLGNDPAATPVEDIVNIGRHGIHCCEAGGPEAGLGCGGRMVEFMDEMELLESGGYDVAIFDVLGDVVCGGFAAPLRKNFAEKVLIVVSEQPMSLFAANNIARAVVTYKRNGIRLAGLIVNQVVEGFDRERLERFAQRLNTRIAATIELDPMIVKGERRLLTIIEHAPGSSPARAIAALGEDLLELGPEDTPLPTPMSNFEYFEFIRDLYE